MVASVKSPVTYKCLRFYENQFEHKLLDKRLIQPYLDHLLILNSDTERAQLMAYGTGSQRYCGSNPSAWLQRKYRAAGGSLLMICSGVDDSDVKQATPWAEFLVGYAKEHPGVQIELGLTHLPTLTDINEHNFLAVKALLDLMAAGIQLFHTLHASPERWHMVFGSGGELLAVATHGEFPSLSTKLDVLLTSKMGNEARRMRSCSVNTLWTHDGFGSSTPMYDSNIKYGTSRTC